MKEKSENENENRNESEIKNENDIGSGNGNENVNENESGHHLRENKNERIQEKMKENENKNENINKNDNDDDNSINFVNIMNDDNIKDTNNINLKIKSNDSNKSINVGEITKSLMSPGRKGSTSKNSEKNFQVIQNSNSGSNSISNSYSTSNIAVSTSSSQSHSQSQSYSYSHSTHSHSNSNSNSHSSKDDYFHSPYLSPSSNLPSFKSPSAVSLNYSNFSTTGSPKSGSLDAKEIKEFLNSSLSPPDCNTHTSSPVPNSATPILNSGIQPIDCEGFLSSADHFMVISSATSRSSFRIPRVKNQNRVSTPTGGAIGVSTGRESSSCDYSRRTSGQCTPAAGGQSGLQSQSYAGVRRITRASIGNNEDHMNGGVGNSNNHSNRNSSGGSGTASASGTASVANAQWARSPTDRLGSGFSTDLSSVRGSETPVSAAYLIDRSPQNLQYHESGSSSSDRNQRSTSFVLDDVPLLPDLKSALEAIAASAKYKEPVLNNVNTTLTSTSISTSTSVLFKSSPDSPLSYNSINIMNKDVALHNETQNLNRSNELQNIPQSHSILPFPSRTFSDESDRKDASCLAVDDMNSSRNVEFYNQIQQQNTSQYVNLNSLSASQNQSQIQSQNQSQNQSQKGFHRLPAVVEDERIVNESSLNGSVDVNDNEKDGKKFERENNLKDEYIDNDNNYSNNDDNCNNIIVNSRKLTFLIVDDSNMNRRMVRRLLSTCDYRILEATDGKHCLTIWEDIKSSGGYLDVVLMDNSMPIMTG